MDTSKPIPHSEMENTGETAVKMIRCPGCGHVLPEDDLRAQIEHMEENHPEIIALRLRGIEHLVVRDD